MGLREYRRKRDFDATSEPRGGGGARCIFVVRFGRLVNRVDIGTPR